MNDLEIKTREKLQQVNFRIDRDAKRKLQAIAKTRGVKVSDVLRSMLDVFLQNGDTKGMQKQTQKGGDTGE